MEKIRIKNTDVVLLIILMIFGPILSAVLLCIWGHQPQEYHDIIMGLVSSYKENKCEDQVFWVVSVLGMGIIALVTWRGKRREKDVRTPLFRTGPFENKTVLVMVMTLFSFLSYLLIYGTPNWFCLCFFLVSGFSFLKGKEKAEELLLIGILTWLDLVVLFEVLSLIEKKWSYASTLCFILTLWFVFVFAFCHIHNDKLLQLLQLPVPLLILVFLKDKYTYNKETITLLQPWQFRSFIVLILCLLLFNNFKNLVKKAESNQAITVSTCIAAAVFFSGFLADRQGIIQQTVHEYKPASEQVIAFQQFLLGQELMGDYYPVSGLFAMPIGMIAELLGGTYENHYMAFALFRILFLIAIELLLSKYVDRFTLLFLSVFIIFPTYNRLYLVLICYLLLHMKGLNKDSGIWLKVWIWSVFLTGLYYPMYGVGVLIGTIPLGIGHLKKYWVSFNQREKKQKEKELLIWIIVLIPIALSIPFLFKYAGHLLVYAKDVSQATTGIPPLFGQEIGSPFLDFITRRSLRQFLFYAVYFAIPLFLIWFTFLLTIKVIGNKGEVFSEYKSKLICLFFVALFLLAGEIRRVLESVYFSGQHGRFIYVCVLVLIVIMLQHIHFDRNGLICIALIISISSVCGMIQMGDNTKYFNTTFSIDKSYTAIKQNNYEKLGSSGFIETKFLKELESLYDKVIDLQSVRSDIPFLGLKGNSSTYLYVLNLPACGQISLDEATTYDAWLQLKEEIMEQRPAIGTVFQKTAPYYLYHWLMTTDEYKYSEKYEMFLPVEIYQALGLNDTADYNEIKFKSGTNTYQMAGNFGYSIDNLEDVLVKSDVAADLLNTVNTADQTILEYHLPSPVSGSEYDFLYLDLESGYQEERISSLWDFVGIEKKEDHDVVVQWINEESGDTYSFKSALSRGRLLIPLGLVNNWILGEHSSITIMINVPNVNVNEIYFAGLSRR